MTDARGRGRKGCQGKAAVLPGSKKFTVASAELRDKWNALTNDQRAGYNYQFELYKKGL